MELGSAADLAVLGGDDGCGCKLSHTDLSSPAKPWVGAPQVAPLAGAGSSSSPEALSWDLSEQLAMNYQLPGVRCELQGTAVQGAGSRRSLEASGLRIWLALADITVVIGTPFCHLKTRPRP
jgi:hypothetical protein